MVFADVEQLEQKAVQQDASIAQFQSDFRQAVDREARADLMEKRKQTEAELEARGLEIALFLGVFL